MIVLLKRSIWFGRLVLGAGALLFAQLGLGNIGGPVAVAGRTHMTLGSPDAITVVRVQGGVFFDIAVVLAYCLASERRLLAGLEFFATIITGVVGVRLIGPVLDGPGPFKLMVLTPEVALLVLIGVRCVTRAPRVSESGVEQTAGDPLSFPTTTGLNRNIASPIV